MPGGEGARRCQKCIELINAVKGSASFPADRKLQLALRAGLEVDDSVADFRRPDIYGAEGTTTFYRAVRHKADVLRRVAAVFVYMVSSIIYY
jgi:hypothetical protein